jgi:hypothetical protein
MNLTDLLNDLLTGEGIDPHGVLVLRHSPSEPELKKVLLWLAAEKPDVFNAYQQTQRRRVETDMANARTKYVASFIGDQFPKSVFVGLYRNEGNRPLTPEDGSTPASLCLKAWGLEGDTSSSTRWFELAPTDFYKPWKGRLVVSWPGAAKRWWRWADQPPPIPVVALREDSALGGCTPELEEIDLTCDQLRFLPKPWEAALSQWRGVYFIFDKSDGKGYVGSASGPGNVLRRWQEHCSGRGGARLLIPRDPKNFRFTILQRLTPDMKHGDINRVEATWKKRLHTRAPHGLNDN